MRAPRWIKSANRASIKRRDERANAPEHHYKAHAGYGNPHLGRDPGGPEAGGGGIAEAHEQNEQDDDPKYDRFSPGVT